MTRTRLEQYVSVRDVETHSKDALCFFINENIYNRRVLSTERQERYPKFVRLFLAVGVRAVHHDLIIPNVWHWPFRERGYGLFTSRRLKTRRWRLQGGGGVGKSMLSRTKPCWSGRRLAVRFSVLPLYEVPGSALREILGHNPFQWCFQWWWRRGRWRLHVADGVRVRL